MCKMVSSEATTAQENHLQQIGSTHANPMAFRCDLSLTALKKILIATPMAIVGLGITREIYILSFGFNTPLHRLQPLNLNAETSAGTWFASLVLLICSLLAAFIAMACKSSADRWTKYWAGIAAVFLYLSLDESAGLHERMGPIFRAAIHLTDDQQLYFLWTIPMGVLALLFVAIYTRFLLDLPRQLAALFILSGAIFVSGAIGMELVGNYFYLIGGLDTPSHRVSIVIEESMEFAGAVLFACTLIDYIKERFGGATIRLS